MNELNELIQWFWTLETDTLITAWVKANVLIVSVVGVLIKYYVKRTPSPEDDAIYNDIKRVLSLKRK
jgi:hypothetical protein